jgi:hypothetical protein
MDAGRALRCHSEGAPAPISADRLDPCPRPRNQLSEPPNLLHVPIHRMQSAKADFVFFQRRIHSLLDGGRAPSSASHDHIGSARCAAP